MRFKITYNVSLHLNSDKRLFFFFFNITPYKYSEFSRYIDYRVKETEYKNWICCGNIIMKHAVYIYVCVYTWEMVCALYTMEAIIITSRGSSHTGA